MKFWFQNTQNSMTLIQLVAKSRKSEFNRKERKGLRYDREGGISYNNLYIFL